MISLLPSRIATFKKALGDKPFTLLDIGAGNHSVKKIKKHLPACRYYGVDITRDYNNDESDFQLMEGFFEKDLTRLEFDDIPDNFFDLVVMSHIIEHLPNGDQVIQALAPKLKNGGYIYIEFPSAESVNFPSRKDTLNFYDDPTHVRIYSAEELTALLTSMNFTVLKGGVRRDWRNIAMMPVKMLHNRIKYGYVMSSVFWDWYGFAELVWARKG
jgi:SAM-dependent methyltransferase